MNEKKKVRRPAYFFSFLDFFSFLLFFILASFLLFLTFFTSPSER